MNPTFIKALSLPKTIVTEYTYIEDVDDLILGRFIRWVYTDELTKLYPGGFLVSVDSKTNVVLCKNRNRFFTVAFEVAFVFQKMSLDERIVERARTLTRS